MHNGLAGWVDLGRATQEAQGRKRHVVGGVLVEVDLEVIGHNSSRHASVACVLVLTFEQRVSVSAKCFAAFDFILRPRDFRIRVGDIFVQFLDRQGFDIHGFETGLHTLKCGFEIIIHAHLSP